MIILKIKKVLTKIKKFDEEKRRNRILNSKIEELKILFNNMNQKIKNNNLVYKIQNILKEEFLKSENIKNNKTTSNENSIKLTQLSIEKNSKSIEEKK